MLFAGPKLDIPKLRQYFSVDRILTVTPPLLCAESHTARETIIRKASIKNHVFFQVVYPSVFSHWSPAQPKKFKVGGKTMASAQVNPRKEKMQEHVFQLLKTVTTNFTQP